MSEALDLSASASTEKRVGWLQRLLRSQLRSQLEALSSGSVEWVDGAHSEELGAVGSGRRARLIVEQPRFYRDLLLGGSLGAAESYLAGAWHSDDLTGLLRIVAAHDAQCQQLDSGLARWREPLLGLLHDLRSNTHSGSRRNIAAHYDLGNDFFELFLDPTLSYSSAYFERPDLPLEQASTAKIQRICEKLGIGPEDHVLEIGSGWGGFALHAAGRLGCRVTTCTISRQQHELAGRRIREAGLSDRVEVQLRDYRDLAGRYDKLVSIEMIEAVGHDHLQTFFDVCADRLRPGGTMLLQAITVPDANYAAHVRSVDFIKRYIFPGGDLVSVAALDRAAATAGLQRDSLEELTPHYAETLRRWRERMRENLPEMRQLGLDERFLRMWEFYLCYCEAGFEEGVIGLVQTRFQKPADAKRPTGGRNA